MLSDADSDDIIEIRTGFGLNQETLLLEQRHE